MNGENNPLPPQSSLPPQPPIQEFTSPLTGDAGKPKRSKLVIIIIAAAAIFLLAGASWGAYLAYNYFVVSPEKLVLNAIDNLQKIESGIFTLDLQASVKPKFDAGATGGNLLMAGVTAFDLKAGLKTSFAYHDDFFASGSEITFDIPTGTSLPLIGAVTVSPVISLISADKENFYFKIKGIPPVPMYDLSEFNDRWIQVNFQQLQDTYGIKVNPGAQADPAKIKEDQRKFAAAYKKYPFMLLKKLADETVDNEACYHLELNLDKERFKNFTAELIKLAEADQTLPAGTAENYTQSMDDALKDTAISGETWIGKKSGMFKKIVVSILSDTESGIGEFKIAGALSQVNRPQQIDPPAASMSLPEATEKIMGQMMGGMEADMATSTVELIFSDPDTDLDGLTDSAELMYGTDAENPDTDGDGYKDGDEVNNGYDPNGPGKLTE